MARVAGINIPDNKQLIPGRGIVYSGYKWMDGNVF